MDNFIKMIDYVNTHSKNDSYSKIIIYSFENSNKMSHLPITSLADSCFVSTSTVSRFTKAFGFNSYSDFKSYVSINSNIAADYSFRIKKSDLGLIRNNPKLFLSNYKEKIDASLNDVVTNLDLSKVDKILKLINSHKNVYIFGSESSYALLNEIQRGLFISGKLVFSGKETEDFERISINLHENDLAIVFSSFGNFLSDSPLIIENIFKSNCDNIFITQHTENMTTSSFQNILNITKENHIEAGNYPFLFTCEFLVRRYYALFHNKNN